MITINSQQLSIPNRFYSPESTGSGSETPEDFEEIYRRAEEETIRRIEEQTEEIKRYADSPEALKEKPTATITEIQEPLSLIEREPVDHSNYRPDTRPLKEPVIEEPNPIPSNYDKSDLAHYTDGDKIDQNPTTLLPFRYVPIRELPTQDEIEGNEAYNEALRRLQKKNEDNPTTKQQQTREKGKGRVQPIYTPDSKR